MTARKLGFWGAVSLGVGAIVGGGILALAGPALALAGPSAMVAILCNGLLATLTALSFAELVSRFPESGGTYNFARKILPIDAAFGIGWVVFFASVVAATLYARGSGYYVRALLSELAVLLPVKPPVSAGQTWDTALAAAFVLLLALASWRGPANWEIAVNALKVLAFGLLIAGGAWAWCAGTGGDSGGGAARWSPFFAGGVHGLVQAAGLTFIALQGFDLVAAVAGDVDQPARTVPRAMIAALAIALAVYVPLLAVMTGAGVPPDRGSITELARASPEETVLLSAQQFFGPAGYWLVLVVAILAMVSALQANLLAASKIAAAMARDRTLPAWLGQRRPGQGAPPGPLVFTAALVLLLLLALPDLAAAGAAASLVFLVSFTLVHWLAVVARTRSQTVPPWAVPGFPFVTATGGLGCLLLAVYQGMAVPEAGLIVLAWLALGILAFLGLSARPARLEQTASVALDPELSVLRGQLPLVLVPVANPYRASGLLALAQALAPIGTGRVVALTVLPPAAQQNTPPHPLSRHLADEVTLKELLGVIRRHGSGVEWLWTAAEEPLEEIVRVARLHRCRTVVLGWRGPSGAEAENQPVPMETLLARLTADVVLVRAPEGWHTEQAKRILVPLGGRGGHEELLVRILASLQRSGPRHITFLQVIPGALPDRAVRRSERRLRQYLSVSGIEQPEVLVQRSDGAAETVVEASARFDLVVLGTSRQGRRRLFGTFIAEVASRMATPLLLISRYG